MDRLVGQNSAGPSATSGEPIGRGAGDVVASAQLERSMRMPRLVWLVEMRNTVLLMVSLEYPAQDNFTLLLKDAGSGSQRSTRHPRAVKHVSLTLAAYLIERYDSSFSHQDKTTRMPGGQNGDRFPSVVFITHQF